MKKRINIALAALNFLHRVLSETGVVTKVDARKQNSTYRCMEPSLTIFREDLDKIRVDYREKEQVPDGRGVLIDRWIIPEAKKKEFEEKILEVENRKVDVAFDKESFSTLNLAFDELFTRQAALKEKGESGGISNETTMKLIEEAASALEGATDVD